MVIEVAVPKGQGIKKIWERVLLSTALSECTLWLNLRHCITHTHVANRHFGDSQVPLIIGKPYSQPAVLGRLKLPKTGAGQPLESKDTGEVVTWYFWIKRVAIN